MISALATSLLLVLAMPGLVGWWPLLLCALVPLLRFSWRETPVRSGLAGLLGGFVHHLILLYWIVIVLGRYGGLPLFISLPALVLLALYMSLYTGLCCATLSFLARRSERRGGGTGADRAALVWISALLWVACDWLRGWLFTGFPWMDLGYGLYAEPLLIQAADLGGHHLLTFALVLINGLALWLGEKVAYRQRSGGRGELAAILAAVSFLVVLGGYSSLRLDQVAAAMQRAPSLAVAVVQGNIRQDEKWTEAKKEQTIDIYCRLSRRAVESQALDLLVWPETAVPFFPQVDPLFEVVAALAEQEQVWLLTGIPYFRPRFDSPGNYDYFNSALLLGTSGRIASRYDKQHLVPFGEYVPLRRFLPFVAPLVESVGNFSAGTSEKPLQCKGVKTGLLICYESIFPELARRQVAAGANLLINITNDAWYGRSSAPWHTLAMSVLRAVENRRGLVRAANTGISGFVAPTGQVLQHSPLFEPAALSAAMPVLTQETLYGRGGHWFGVLCLLAAMLLVAHGLVVRGLVGGRGNDCTGSEAGKET